MAQKVEQWTVLSMLEWATDYFEKKEVKNPRLSIEWLLSDVLSVKRLDLYLMFDRPLTKQELDAIRPLVKRRAEHEPLQYITGYTSFLNVELDVNEHVLIPRMETEYLVEIILNDFKDQEELKVLDIATGSGCIPIALKKEKPNWDISAFDLSSEALNLAKSNATKNEVDVEFFEADLFEFESVSAQQYDLIISNPPYVMEEERSSLDKEVLDYEPHLALFTNDTSKIFSALEKTSRQALKKNGRIYLEINAAKSEKVLEIFTSISWKSEVKNDLDGKPRFVISKAL